MSNLTLTTHGLAPGDQIYFVDVEPSDCGLFTGILYNVLTTPDANTFTVAVADDVDQIEVDLLLDITSGSILNAAATYTPLNDDVTTEPDPVPTPSAPTVSSALVSGIVRLRVVLNDIATPKVREWEVQVTHKYTDEAPIAGTATGSNATDTITLASHGLTTGDDFRFSTCTGGSNVVVGDTYYVIASGLTSSAFKFSATPGGSAFDFGSDISAADLVAVIPAEADWTTPLTITIPAGVAGGEECSLPALGNTNYTVRVRAGDVYGQFGSYSDEVDATTLEGSDSLSAAIAAIANGVDGRVIDSTNILPNSIETGMIQANAITADLLAATLILSALIYAGGTPDGLGGVTGQHVEIDGSGIRLVDSSDNLIVNIPTDSTQPVYFKGKIVADDFTSQATNDLSGSIGVTGSATMTLANGVAAPTVAPTVTAYAPTNIPYSGAPTAVTKGIGYDSGAASFWIGANPDTGYVAHEYSLSTGAYIRSIGATGSTTTVTTTYGSTSHISDTAEATDSASETQIATPIVMPRDGRITKVSIYLAGHNDSPSVRNCVWSNGGTLIDNSASYAAANEGATGVGDSHQYNKALADGAVNYIGGNTYKVGAMLTSDSFVGWQWDRDDGSGKTTYLGSGENFDDFTVTRTETTHKPNVYITYEYDVDSRLETDSVIGVATDGTYIYTLDELGQVWKYLRSDLTYVAKSGVQTAISGTKANAGMFYDATAGELIITTFTGTGAGVFPKFVRVNTSTLAVSSTVYSAAAGTTFNGTNDVIRGGCRVSDDVNGGGAATYWVTTYTAALVGSVYAYTFSGTTATQVSNRDFGQYSTVAAGLMHTTAVDSTGYFYGLSGANIYQFTRWDWTTASAIYWFAHAWYNDAATAVTGGTAAASTNLVTKASHGLSIGDKVQFTTLTGGTGLSLATDYYVIASGFTTGVFKVSTTSGGSEVDITVDYSVVSFRTIYETAVSPRSSLTLRRREGVTVQQTAIPSGGASLPNKVRIYFKPNATDPGAGNFKRQITDAGTSRLFITYDSAGAADAQGTAFATGTPATLQSAKSLGTTAGALGWAQYGDGSIRAPYPKVTVLTSGTAQTFTPSTGVNYATVECVGGGGGGAGAANSSAGNASLGTSGGGGGYARKTLSRTELLAGTITYTVGTGGAGVSGSTAPNAGNNTTFAGSGFSTITGGGGSAGVHLANGSSVLTRPGGTGGTASGGDINCNGQPASDGNRNATPLAASGTAGASGGGLGAGGKSVTSGTANDGSNGNAGTGYGGGGSGAFTQGGTTAKTGGNGADGVIIVTEYFGA